MGEKISTILSQIDSGSVALPEFQRGYVWNRDQVRGLMTSLYKGYPVGSLLVWETQSSGARTRNDQTLAPGVVKLLLDGQQRITSLYGVVKGKAPQFFEGDDRAFTGLYFNIETEEFEFYAPIKMGQDRSWIDVSNLMKQGAIGLGQIVSELAKDPQFAGKVGEYTGRVAKLLAINEKEVHIETVTGEDKTIDVVVDIFNKVNSGGTKLSKGDLALARISAGRPETRHEMKAQLARLENEGYRFDLDWLLRNINAVATGEAKFKYLHELSHEAVSESLTQAGSTVEMILSKIADRLGLDHDQVLFGRGAIPVMTHYVQRRGVHGMDGVEWDRLLFWYVQAAIKGRYSSSVESYLDKDFSLIEDLEGGIDRLITEILNVYGDLRVVPEQFGGWSLGARFYPVLYMMTRMLGARDWGTGVEIKKGLLGKNSTLEVHHIFPKRRLYEAAQNYTKGEVNLVANFCLLTKGSNLLISDESPEVYFPKISAKFPGALESQWIPMDPVLWKIENYRDFLEARKELLARSANSLFEELYHGRLPAHVHDAIPASFKGPKGSILDEEESRTLQEINDWIEACRLPRGEIAYELVDTVKGSTEAILDLAWPEGIQKGYSRPVALLLNESNELILSMQKRDYLVFTNVASFKKYVEEEVLAGVTN